MKIPPVNMDTDNKASGHQEPKQLLAELGLVHSSTEGPAWKPSDYNFDPRQLTASPANHPEAHLSAIARSYAEDPEPATTGQQQRSSRPADRGNSKDIVGGQLLQTLDAAPGAAGIAPARPVPVCQVAGCGQELGDAKPYYQRYKICTKHMRVLCMMIDGKPSRFCQQCGRFHTLDAFDGTRHTCRIKLSRHNARRQARAAELMAQADMGGDSDTGEESGRASKMARGPSSSAGGGSSPQHSHGSAPQGSEFVSGEPQIRAMGSNLQRTTGPQPMMVDIHAALTASRLQDIKPILPNLPHHAFPTLDKEGLPTPGMLRTLGTPPDLEAMLDQAGSGVVHSHWHPPGLGAMLERTGSGAVHSHWMVESSASGMQASRSSSVEASQLYGYPQGHGPTQSTQSPWGAAAPIMAMGGNARDIGGQVKALFDRLEEQRRQRQQGPSAHHHQLAGSLATSGAAQPYLTLGGGFRRGAQSMEVAESWMQRSPEGHFLSPSLLSPADTLQANRLSIAGMDRALGSLDQGAAAAWLMSPRATEQGQQQWQAWEPQQSQGFRVPTLSDASLRQGMRKHPRSSRMSGSSTDPSESSLERVGSGISALFRSPPILNPRQSSSTQQQQQQQQQQQLLTAMSVGMAAPDMQGLLTGRDMGSTTGYWEDPAQPTTSWGLPTGQRRDAGWLPSSSGSQPAAAGQLGSELQGMADEVPLFMQAAANLSAKMSNAAVCQLMDIPEEAPLEEIGGLLGGPGRQHLLAHQLLQLPGLGSQQQGGVPQIGQQGGEEQQGSQLQRQGSLHSQDSSGEKPGADRGGAGGGSLKSLPLFNTLMRASCLRPEVAEGPAGDNEGPAAGSGFGSPQQQGSGAGVGPGKIMGGGVEGPAQEVNRRQLAADLVRQAAAPPSLSYAPTSALARLSLKLYQCTPEQLPADLQYQLVMWLATTDAAIVQGAIRPGCTHLVLDILGPLDIEARLDNLLAASVSAPCDDVPAPNSVLSFVTTSTRSSVRSSPSGSPRRSLRNSSSCEPTLSTVLGSELLGKSAVLVQGKNKVVVLGPGTGCRELPLQQMEEWKERPQITRSGPLCLKLSDTSKPVVHLKGEHLDLSVQPLLRHEGAFLPCTWSDNSGSDQSGPEKGVAVQLPASSIQQPGLYVLDCDKAPLMSNWRPILILEEPAVVDELEQLEQLASGKSTPPEVMHQAEQVLVDIGLLVLLRERALQDTSLDCQTPMSGLPGTYRPAPLSSGGSAVTRSSSRDSGFFDDRGMPSNGQHPVPATTPFAAFVNNTSQNTFPAAFHHHSPFEGSDTWDKVAAAQPHGDSFRRVSSQSHASGAGNSGSFHPSLLNSWSTGASTISSLNFGPETPSPAWARARNEVLLARRLRTAAAHLVALCCDRRWPATLRLVLNCVGEAGLADAVLINTRAAEGCWLTSQELQLDGLSPLHRAVRSGSVEVVQVLLDWAYDWCQTLDWACTGSVGLTPLHLAAVMEDSGTMASFLRSRVPMLSRLWYTLQGPDSATPSDYASGHVPSSPACSAPSVLKSPARSPSSHHHKQAQHRKQADTEGNRDPAPDQFATSHRAVPVLRSTLEHYPAAASDSVMTRLPSTLVAASALSTSGIISPLSSSMHSRPSTKSFGGSLRHNSMISDVSGTSSMTLQGTTGLSSASCSFWSNSASLVQTHRDDASMTLTHSLPMAGGSPTDSRPMLMLVAPTDSHLSETGSSTSSRFSKRSGGSGGKSKAHGWKAFASRLHAMVDGTKAAVASIMTKRGHAPSTRQC